MHRSSAPKRATRRLDAASRVTARQLHRPKNTRSPAVATGLVGLLGLEREGDRPYYSIIADGIHADPASVAIAHRAHPRGAVQACRGAYFS